MASDGAERERPASAAPSGDDGAEGEGRGEGETRGPAGVGLRPPPRLHELSFKLRFPGRREPGRSCVSLVRPLGLPAPVSGKFHERPEPQDEAAEARALRRVRDAFERGPREKYAAPLTTAHECGWWSGRAAALAGCERADRRLHRPLRDSAWLRERLRVLAHDARL